MSGEIPTDPEKQIIKENGSSDTAGASPERDEYAYSSGSRWTRIVDSFRRDPNASVVKKEAVSRGRFDHKSAAENTANTGLAQKLQSRHMQMIAIGGSIGMSFSPVPLYFSMLTSQELVSSSPPARPSQRVARPLWSSPSASSVSSCSAPCRLWVSLPCSSPSLVPSPPTRPVSSTLPGASPWAGSEFSSCIHSRATIC
jgi:hypothetical protein